MGYFKDLAIDKMNQSNSANLLDFALDVCKTCGQTDQAILLLEKQYEICKFITTTVHNFREIEGTLEDIEAAPGRVIKMLDDFKAFHFIGVDELHAAAAEELENIVNEFIDLLEKNLHEEDK